MTEIDDVSAASTLTSDPYDVHNRSHGSIRHLQSLETVTLCNQSRPPMERAADKFEVNKLYLYIAHSHV